MYVFPHACCASIKAFVYNVGKAFPPAGEPHPNKGMDEELRKCQDRVIMSIVHTSW